MVPVCAQRLKEISAHNGNEGTKIYLKKIIYCIPGFFLKILFKWNNASVHGYIYVWRREAESNNDITEKSRKKKLFIKNVYVISTTKI